MRTRIPAVTSGEPLDPGMPADLTDGSARPPGWLPVAAAAVFLAVLGSCDSDPVVEPEPALEIVPDSVTLTHIGDQFAFTVRGGEAVRWNSLDLAVFTVDTDGTVTARGNGTAQVQAWTPESSDHALVRVRQLADVLEAFGEGQRAAAGLSLIEPVGVRALDAGGAPISGTTVRFEPGAGHGAVEPVEVQTDSTGLAAARWKLGPEPGRHTLKVSAEGVAAVEIAAIALQADEAVDSFEVHAGQDQWAWSGRALAEPIVVQALDQGGRPMPAATVRFEPDAGGRADPEMVVSDSSGVSSTTWTLGKVAGPQTLAISTGGDARVEVIATARDPDGAVASVEVRSGEDQWGLAAQALPDSVAVIVTDDTGQPVWGAEVRFEPEAGGGRADPGVTVTDSVGLAAAVWTLGPDPGAQRLAVTAGTATVMFEAVAVSDEGVCNRTPAVSAEIARQAGVRNCSDVTEDMLGDIPRLVLVEKGLTRLSGRDFAGLARVDELYLSRNRLTELPSGAFADLTHLRRLLLDNNEITDLSPEVFEGLSHLEDLYFYQNRITELAPETFAGLQSLGTLGFGFNELTDLPDDIFDGLSNLETLTMRGNMLTSLPEDVFAGLPRLGYLIVGDNRLTKLPPGLFSDTPALWRIALDGNQLTELPPELFSDTPALQRLYLQDNRLTALPQGIFDGLPELVRLDLSDNDLAKLPPGVFSGTPKLAELRLEYNDLSELPRGVFAGLSELEWATLGSNPGAPFPVQPEFARVDDEDPLAAGPAVLVARVPVGAPFAFDLPVSVQRGTISQDFVSLLPGDTASAPFTVAGTGAGVAAHVGFGPAPEVTAAGHTGLAVERGEELVLFAKTENRSPFTRSPVPAHRMQAGGPSAELALDEYFGDPEGDTLAYEAVTTVAGVVEVAVEDGVLWLDPLSVDTTEVEVTATDPGGLRATQRFRAWVVPEPDPDAFDIELYFEPGFTPEEEATIRRAADRWMEAVTGDLPDVPVRGSISDYCRYREPANLRLVGVVDDVLIRMRLASRLNGNVATAGYCAARESGFDFIAMNSFALWYVRGPHPDLEHLYRSAMHEIGHVLGFGDWIFGPSPQPWKELFRGRGGDLHFAGPLAVAAFDAAGGEAYSGGKVPLEDRIPVLGIHWRQSVIPGDVMAPYGDTLLTAITLQALADIGHEVDLSKADPYTLPSQAHADVGVAGADAEGAEAAMPADDVIGGPVVVVDKDGKLVRIIRR